MNTEFKEEYFLLQRVIRFELRTKWQVKPIEYDEEFEVADFTFVDDTVNGI